MLVCVWLGCSALSFPLKPLFKKKINLTQGEDLEAEDVFILPFLFKPEKNFQGRNSGGITKDYPKKCPRRALSWQVFQLSWPLAHLYKYVQIEVWLIWGVLGGLDGKESACNAGDLSSIPWSGRSSREGNGYPLQYSCLKNSKDRRAWQAMGMVSQRVRHD